MNDLVKNPYRHSRIAKASLFKSMLGTVLFIVKGQPRLQKAPKTIGSYQLISSNTEKFKSINFGIGIYEKNGEMVFIKTWSGKFKDRNYYYLENEIIVGSIIREKLAETRHKDVVSIPEIKEVIRTKDSLSVVFEYIDGKDLTELQSEIRLTICKNALNALEETSYMLTENDRKYFVRRTALFHLFSSFFAAVIVSWRYPSKMLILLQALQKSFISANDLDNVKLTLAHGDFYLKNIIVKGNTTYLVDCGGMALILPFYDAFRLVLNPNANGLESLMPSVTPITNYSLIRNYISLHSIISYKNDIFMRKHYFQIMSLDKTQHTGKIYLSTLWKRFKQYLYSFKYSSKEKVAIRAFDPRGMIIAESIIRELKRAVQGNLIIHLLGSVSLRIAGKRDIDIFIECAAVDFNLYVQDIVKILGDPVLKKWNYIEWKIEREGWEINILLIDPTTEKFKDQMTTTNILQNNKLLCDEYEKLKWSLNGASSCEYESAKYRFYEHLMNSINSNLASFDKSQSQNTGKDSDKILLALRKPLSVTIGIPAYNEEKNIGKIIEDIQSQKGESFIVKEIIVISDGSNDSTAVRAAHYNGIIVVDDGKRKGKALRINEIFRRSKTDVVIIFDADITLVENAIEQLLQPFFAHTDIMLASGTMAPLSPKTFAGKIAFVAYYLWSTAILMTRDADMYHCSGPMRAFRKAFYETLTFPAATADDIFPYFECKLKGYGFSYAENILGYYKLPATLSDFKKQQKRFLNSRVVQTKNFGSSVITQYHTMRLMTKIKSLAITFTKFPFATIAYFAVWVPMKIETLLVKQKKAVLSGTWDPVVSTK